MKKLFVGQGLTTQVVIWGIIPISLILILVSFGSLSLHRDAMRTMVGERDRRTVRSAAGALREQLNHRAATVQGLAIRLEDGGKPDEVLSSAAFLLSDFDAGLAFYSTDGEVLAFSGDQETWLAIEGEVIAEINKYLDGEFQDIHFSDPIPDPIYDNYFGLVIFQPTPNAPVAVGAFSITKLARQSLAGTSSYDEGTTILLTDREGHVLYLSSRYGLESEPLDHPGVYEALHGESGTTYIRVEDTEHVVAFSQVAPTGWALILEESWDSVTSPMLRYTELGPVVLLPMILFAVSALWFSARQIIQPLKELEEKAAALEWGDFQAVKDDVGGIEEIKNLQRTLIHMSDRIQASQEGLRSYIAAITEGQEEERKRLARELHDETLQSVIALNQRIQLLKRSAQSPETQRAVTETEEMIGETIVELRRFTRALRPLYLEDLGLVPALQMLAKEFEEGFDLNIQFQKVGDEIRLSDAIEIAIYRIAQESLNNVIRHAQASEVQICLKFENDQVCLEVNDNGIGFEVPASPSELAPEGHYGLLGIYERAELLGAICKIDSIIDEGTSISIALSFSE